MMIEWDVSTKPNHFHPRMDKMGYSSPMIGDHDIDLPCLFSLFNRRFIKIRISILN